MTLTTAPEQEVAAAPEAPPPRRVRRDDHSRGWAVMLVACIVVALGLWWSLRSGEDRPERVSETERLSVAEFEAVTGLHIDHLALTGGGGMVDFSYQVVDPAKADVLHTEGQLPGLYDPASGRLLERPFHDHRHDDDFTPAAIYHELIVNADRVLESGDEVTLLVGPYRVEGVELL